MASGSRSSGSSCSGIIGGYWPSWYASKNPPSTIPASYYTHVFYAFVNPDPDASFKLKIEDKKLMRNFTSHLHSNNSNVKAFLAAGGKEAETAISAMASNKSNRRKFIESVIEVARKYSFDGVNMGWEFPIGKESMKNLVSLLTELRVAVDGEAHQTRNTKLGLSASVFFAPDLCTLKSDRHSAYPAKLIASEVDFVNVMCYDYAGHWSSSRTGSIAALHNKRSNYSTSYGIQKWIEGGVPKEKLVMGLPLYGWSWELKDGNNHGIGALAVGVGPQDDEYSPGYMLYHNVVTFNEIHEATVEYDEETVSYYSHSGTSWISYDGEISIQAKVRYAREKRLGGYYFWAIGQDCQDNRLATAAATAWRS
ncbi:hypothetical protein MKW92_015864 [Papaver armeniacum]|nr:hypothetical protein MKW92_015864 [Papaver armeniacum]